MGRALVDPVNEGINQALVWEFVMNMLEQFLEWNFFKDPVIYFPVINGHKVIIFLTEFYGKEMDVWILFVLMDCWILGIHSFKTFLFSQIMIINRRYIVQMVHYKMVIIRWPSKWSSKYSSRWSSKYSSRWSFKDGNYIIIKWPFNK